jgi:hypothetical protein
MVVFKKLEDTRTTIEGDRVKRELKALVDFYSGSILKTYVESEELMRHELLSIKDELRVMTGIRLIAIDVQGHDSSKTNGRSKCQNDHSC